MRTVLALVVLGGFVAACSSPSSPATPSSAVSHGAATLSLTSGVQPLSDGGAYVQTIVAPCHFFDGTGNWTQAIGDCEFHIVAAPNGNVASVTAKGQTTPAPSGQAVQWDQSNTGIPCKIDNTSYTTSDWQETVSPTGAVNMHCAFH